MRFITLFLLLIVCSVTHAQLPEVYGGEIVRLESFNSKYIPDRNVDIWLPPEFDASKEYPVIYMHDGQMLFDANTTWNKQEWQVDEVATRLIKEQQVTPFIVVGVWNNSDNRHSEYFPQKPFESMPEERKALEYSRMRGGDLKLFHNPIYSDKYLKFLVEELKPFIEDEYKVKPESSYLLGSSMGGLISWYGLLEYPDEFQGAACLSTHWPGNFSDVDNPIPSYFQSYIQANLTRLSRHKLYFDYGTETLDAMYPELQEEVNSILSTSDYPKELWHSQKFEGANHSENAWAARLDHPIKFLLSKKPD
ncbi:esterase [Alteromonadaceae bacterium M269]|nr:esterase [Alteromonadaceae bacterium M269]